MKFPSLRFLLFFLLAFGAISASAQTTAVLTGVVTDSTGAVLPGVTIVLTNPATGVKYQVVTDSIGSYRVSSVPPGPGYQIRFVHDGFSPYEIKDIYINVANVRTQNATLTPGTTVDVKVTSDTQVVTLNTTDASIGNNFQVTKLDELPVQNRMNPTALFTLQPGITSSGATTGARTDQTNASVDGLDVNDLATGSFASITAGAPVDSVQEFRGSTAGFTADNGPGGGGQFQLITRGGTNNWHGNINLYHRDNSTVANDWFNANSGVRSPKLVRNQFGGSVGGPAIHDKLFFFFNYLNARIAQDATVSRIVPLPTFVAGNVSYINNNAGCTASSRQNTTPTCISSLSPAQVKAMDPAGIGASAQLLQLFKRYPSPNDLTLGDGVNTGGYRFNYSEPDNQTNYVGRMDWVFSEKIKFWGVGRIMRRNQVRDAGQFPSDSPATTFIDRSYSYVGGMDWQISGNKFNQFAYGSVVQDFAFPKPMNALGLYQDTFATGTTTLLSAPYSSPSNAQSRRVPISQVKDDFSWTLGRHSLQMGGYFKWILSHNQSILDYNTYSIGLGTGIAGLNSSLRPTNLRSGTTAATTYDSAFAALLGHISQIDSTFNYTNTGATLAQGSGSVRDYRYYQLQPYISDTWKVSPHLTLNLGVNYEFYSVPYETHGSQTVQTMGFNQYFAARLAQSAQGISGPTSVPLFTYVLGGPKNHGPGYYHSILNNFAPHIGFAYNPGFDSHTVFNGSIGITYDRTIINAVQYQQDQHSYLFSQENATSFATSGDPVGSLASDPRLSAPPVAAAPAAPKSPYLPFVDDTNTPYGLQNGQAFNSMIDPHLKTPYNIMISAGMQHQFPGSYILRINYVGRLGRRLLAQVDTNQLIDFPDQKSGQLMSQAMGNMTVALRNGANPKNMVAQPWIENQVIGIGAGTYPNKTSRIANAFTSLIQNGDFADTIQALSPYMDYNVGMAAQFSENTMYTNKGFSSYNGLLLTLQKNFSHGLQFDFNYTWSHSIDNVSLIANGIASGGYGFICDAVHPRACRGNSDFDATQYISSDFTYQLPIGRGRTFAHSISKPLNALLGDWDLSGIPSFHTGQAFSTVTSAFVAGYANNAPAIFNGDTGAIRRRVHKDSNGAVQLFDDPTAAVNAFTGPVGLQIGSRNNLRSPSFFNIDAGLAKNVPLTEKLSLQFRADAFNVLNHPNFNQLNFGSYGDYVDITQPSHFGQLTAINGGNRVVQLSGRINF